MISIPREEFSSVAMYQYLFTYYRENMTGLCSAGYYCPNASVTAEDIDCPVGHYCPLGSATPEPCQNGTFSDSERLTAQVKHPYQIELLIVIMEIQHAGHNCNLIFSLKNYFYLVSKSPGFSTIRFLKWGKPNNGSD